MYNSGTSGDVFCEVMVSHRKGTQEKMIIALAVVIGIVLTAAIFIFIPPFLIFAVAIWAGIGFIIKLQKVEYEYAYTSGELDIDKISGDFSRKHKLSISMDTVEIVAPIDSYELDNYKRGNYRVYDFSANDPHQKNYVMVGTLGSEQVKIIITPNEKLLDQMFMTSPRKVKRA